MLGLPNERFSIADAADLPMLTEEFSLVTGISTGALAAPRGLLAARTHDAIADSQPLAELIARYFDEALLGEIATGYRGGRQLIIGTTNLDA